MYEVFLPNELVRCVDVKPHDNIFQGTKYLKLNGIYKIKSYYEEKSMACTPIACSVKLIDINNYNKKCETYSYDSKRFISADIRKMRKDKLNKIFNPDL